jgi:hypothetical protein
MDAENQGTFFPDFSIQRMIDCINAQIREQMSGPKIS